MSVDLYINNQKFIVNAGSSLFEYAESFSIHIPTSCTKQGKCKECLIDVIEGIECLSDRTILEEHLNAKGGITKENGYFRLSCQCRIVKDSGIVRCNTMHRGNMRIENKAFRLPVNDKKLEIDPAVTKFGKKVLLDGNEIGESNCSIYGIAMDLGTTTVVLRLFNLETGEIVADSSFENPQRFGGSDVMSRIHYDTNNSGKLLQRTLAGYITHAIEDFPVDPQNIYEMVVAGNSTMRDIFFRLNVYPIGQNPYRSITELEMLKGNRKSTSISSSPKRLLLPINSKARIYGLPIISGHVGADAAACILAVDLLNEERLVTIMDIGTNTELILGNKDKIFAASCPAGPAFEGGNITFGMPGLPGAIEKLKIETDESISFEVIGNTEPEGIADQGLLIY